MCQKDNNIKVRKGKHLNYTERQLIERWYNKEKRSKIDIACFLNRSEKTIRNEIKRGLVKNLTTDLIEIWVYSADVSQERYEYYLTGKGPQLKIGNDYMLKEYIENSIKVDKNSPEVVSEKIKTMDFNVKLSARTIRNYIYVGGILDIKSKDMIYNKKRKNKNKDKKICEKVPPEKSIEYRPKDIDNRTEYGHWEGDLVIGKRKKSSVLFTLTERKTRKEIILKIPGKKSDYVVSAMDKIEKKYKDKFSETFKTITFDNGVEFRDYKGLEKSYDKRKKNNRTIIYYAHPYCSGERGTNENSNRLIRRFIPKGVDIDEFSDEYIQEIENWINNYPRAMFGYKSSNQMLSQIL